MDTLLTTIIMDNYNSINLSCKVIKAGDKPAFMIKYLKHYKITESLLTLITEVIH
jgi:hypothetical protein